MAESKQISAIICDFDGVLLESAEIKTKAFERLFETVSPKQLPAIVAYHEANMGHSRYVKFRYIYEQILQRSLPPEEEQQLGRRFSEIVVSQLLEAPLVAGVREFLYTLKTPRPYLLFVASGTPTHELCLVAKAKGLFAEFQEWHGSPRSKPEIVNDLLSRYALKPDEAVFIGDAASDQSAARQTGLHFIARVAGSGSALENCRYKIRDFFELPERLEQLCAKHLTSRESG